jgi:hypothetical protein
MQIKTNKPAAKYAAVRGNQKAVTEAWAPTIKKVLGESISSDKEEMNVSDTYLLKEVQSETIRMIIKRSKRKETILE